MADLYLLLALCLCVVSAEIRGLDPSRTVRYNKERFVCFDDSREIPYEAVNDDYCDCLDGSDEPGTSACARGVFYCHNKGYRPIRIASFFVDDGFCDCCDGSDEKHINCPNTCLKLGEKIKKELKEKIEIYKLSLMERQRRANEAEGIKEKWREELKTCLNDIERQQARCKELKARLDILEAEEKEKEKTEETTNRTANVSTDNTDTDVDSKQDGDTTDSREEEDTDVDATVEALHDDDQHEGQSKEDNEVDEGEDMDTIDEETIEENEEDEDVDEEGIYEDTSEGEEEGEDSDSLEEVTPPLLTRLKKWGRSLWSPGKKPNPNPNPKAETKIKRDEDAPTEDLELHELKKEYSKEKKELRNLEQRRDGLRTKLDRYYGDDGRFISLVDQCFEGKQDKYTYVICPFDHADQKEGRRKVTLGRFDGFTDDDRVMHFKRGQRCPGKQRSLTVKLRCGEKEDILSADEPAMCEYTADFSTPVACTESELKHLEKEARSMGLEGLEDVEDAVTRTEQNVKDEL